MFRNDLVDSCPALSPQYICTLIYLTYSNRALQLCQISTEGAFICQSWVCENLLYSNF